MPTLIIHELHQKPRAVTLEKNKIVIGREDACDLVLSDTSVSRQHAQIFLAKDMNFYIQMLSGKNPILVNGEVTSKHKSLGEGDELQFGPYLIFFSKENKPLQKYMQQKSHRYEAHCVSCSWEGTLSEHTRNPACPRCGGTDFEKPEEVFANPMANERTSTLDATALARLHQSTKTAKTARIERLVPLQGKPSKINLTESTTVVIGGMDSDLPFKGMSMGGQCYHFLDRIWVSGQKRGSVPQAPAQR